MNNSDKTFLNEDKKWYNSLYLNENFFGYKQWLFSPYVSSILKKAKLTTGSSILDAGCGQGFFTELLNKKGMDAYGIDISEIGLRCAKKTFQHIANKLVVCDIECMPFRAKFDCVFTRSCSLYNTSELSSRKYITDILFDHVKPGGVFVFAYNSNLKLAKKRCSWNNHSLRDVKRHFANYDNVKYFYLNRLDVFLMKKYAFNNMVTSINALISRTFGFGSEIVFIIRKAA